MKTKWIQRHYLGEVFFNYWFLGIRDGRVRRRGGKIGPVRWASPIHPKLGPDWAIKLLARKKSGQIWPGPIWPCPVWPDLTRSVRIFFVFKRLFGSISPVFRAGWATKILARKNQVNFGSARFWLSPLLTQPSPARPDPSNCQLHGSC